MLKPPNTAKKIEIRNYAKKPKRTTKKKKNAPPLALQAKNKPTDALQWSLPNMQTGNHPKQTNRQSFDKFLRPMGHYIYQNEVRSNFVKSLA